MIHFELWGEAQWIGGIGTRNMDLPVECGVNRVLVRTTPHAGEIHLSASAEGLKPAYITLRSETVDAARYQPSLTLQCRLDRGEALSVYADRFSNPKKVIQSKIHGFKVNLSRGPFSLAVNRGIDVYMVSAMKMKDGSYDGRITFLDYDKSLPHREQRQQLADLYTAEIEKILSDYPLQWFNYFDIWVDE